MKTKLNFKKWLFPGIAAIVMTVVGCQYLARGKTPQMTTAVVERGNIEKTVTAVGSLQPKDYVDVGTQVSGKVEKIHVDINDAVKKGQLIAEIDSRTYESTVRKDEANLENLRAQLRQQQAQLALAKEQLSRNQKMIATNAVAQSVLDEAQATLDVADANVASTAAQIKAAQATLDGDRTNLSYTKIYAPIDGTVVSQTTLEGQTVNAAQSAPVIVQVANLDVMTVWAQVAEADVSKLKPGMKGYFTTLGAPDKKWQGTVRQVQPTPVTENDVVLYNVLIDVANPDHELLPQMTVQVFFVLGEAQDVPVAPLNALKSQDGAYTAQVVTDKGIEQRTVVIGLANRRVAQVRSGLSIGEKLLISNETSPSKPAAGGRPPQGARL